LSGEHAFSRLELLVGPECVEALAGARVIVFGVGGVGSWCAEALVRSGIHKLTIVDSDVVCVTNINRQLPATSATVGMPKVDVLGGRLREVNPAAEVTALRMVYNWETKGGFDLGAYDYVIDAIDSLGSKVELIVNAYASGATVFSALGAACKVDPALARVSSIWKSDKCKLGRFVRKRLRRRGFDGDFLCVWSDEEKFSVGGGGICGDIDDDNAGDCGNISNNDVTVNGIDGMAADISESAASPCPTNKTVNGSIVHVTGVFGFMLSGLVVQDIINKVKRGAGS